MTRDNFTYLGIEEGAPTRLVIGWSPYGDLRNLWMLAVCASDRLVGSRNVQDYRIVVDPDHSFYALTMMLLRLLRTRYVTIGDIKFFFDLVKNVHYMSFHDEVNQHPRVYRWI